MYYTADGYEANTLVELIETIVESSLDKGELIQIETLERVGKDYESKPVRDSIKFLFDVQLQASYELAVAEADNEADNRRWMNQDWRASR